MSSKPCDVCGGSGILFSPGYIGLVDASWHSPTLERCDSCKKYKDDNEAMAAVQQRYLADNECLDECVDDFQLTLKRLEAARVAHEGLCELLSVANNYLGAFELDDEDEQRELDELITEINEVLHKEP